MLLAIIFVVVFLIWVLGAWYGATDMGAKYRGGANIALAILIGILGWIVFHGFGELK